ncbi:tachykinin-4 isoform X2 [Phacochoerus africanus]|uniref:tachykinin-4 isoform X2 n=1 Tax=Phacochoerus africanus TaxID=41426 RepID=UPI001FDA3346|nr:tachykinin-4 isoform X2 [Phacochoerus africanus]
MLLVLSLLLLMGLSVGTEAGDKELTLDAKAGSWVTVTLEEDGIPSIQLQLQQVKGAKTSQFFGLMGKQVGGIPPIQPERTGYQRGPVIQGLLSPGGPSTEGREDKDRGSE